MNLTGIALILIGIFVAIFAVAIFSKKDTSKANTANSSKNIVKQNSENLVNIGKQITKKADKDIIKKDIFSFMEFEKIIDNMIIQDKGTKYTMVIQCKGINYDLMSEVEQNAVEEGFITFLNTLKYPIQLYVQARAVDLKKSLDIYKDHISELESQYQNASKHYDGLTNNINSDRREIMEARMEKAKFQNILDYAQDVTRYVEKMSLNKHTLQRKYYIVLSYLKSEIITSSDAHFSKDEIHDICYRELQTRAQSLIGAIAACSVQGKILDSNELAELLYISYNRDDEKLLDVKTALDSGFYRLYSTSKDVFEKKAELMQKEIDLAAEQRVKAALISSMELTKGKTKDELIEEFEESSDVEALNIINESNISDEEKQTLIDIISQRHVIGAEKRKKVRKAIKKIKESDISEKGKDEDNIDAEKAIDINSEENKNTDNDESII